MGVRGGGIIYLILVVVYSSEVGGVGMDGDVHLPFVA